MDVLSTYEEDGEEEVEWDDEVEDEQVDYLLKFKRDGYKFKRWRQILSSSNRNGKEEKKAGKGKPSKRLEPVRKAGVKVKNVRAKKEIEEAKAMRKPVTWKACQSRARRTTDEAGEEEEGLGLVVEELKSWMLVQLKLLKKEILKAVQEKKGKGKVEGGGSTEGKANVRDGGVPSKPEGGNQRMGKQRFSGTESENGSFKLKNRKAKRALHSEEDDKA